MAAFYHNFVEDDAKKATGALFNNAEIMSAIIQGMTATKLKNQLSAKLGWSTILIKCYKKSWCDSIQNEEKLRPRWK